MRATTDCEERPLLAVEHPRLNALLEYWKSVCPENGPPKRVFFGPEMLQPWLGHIGVVGIETEPLRFLVRLSGTVLVAYDGRDNTGRYLDEVITDSEHAVILRPYIDCARTGMPQADSVYYRSGPSTHRQLHRLLLPVSSDGVAMDQIVIGIYGE